LITADPNVLRFGASRFSAAAQELRRKSVQLEQLTHSIRQGQEGWSGEGSQAFLLRGERLVADVKKASLAFESIAVVLNQFAMRMEHVLELRRRADRLEQQAFQYGDYTPDDIHIRQNLRRQAAQLRHQADSEASLADKQAAAEFQSIAQMIPSTLLPGADASANLLAGLPKHWQEYYRRHPELLEEERTSVGYNPATRRTYLLAILLAYHKSTQSPWLPDEDREEAARIYCEQAYSKLSVEELEKEILSIWEEEENAQKWQDLIQSGVPATELIKQKDYLRYAFKEYYKSGEIVPGEAWISAGMGKVNRAGESSAMWKIVLPTLQG
jgi:uncharacterized protein YukE